jgi:DNA-directed RNA polymerase specialized sigma subunit
MQHNMRLVDFWARRLIEHSRAAKDISYYELVTEGVIGLTMAAENYDGRGAFIRFAQIYIRGQLYR